MSTSEEFLLVPSTSPLLRDKTLFITGGSRGIGRAIALRAAKDGANIAVVAKTTTPHPKLPGTIYSVAEEIQKAGGRALPIACDIRDETQVQKAIELTVAEFGGLDIVVNNASAISLTGTLETPLKKYDLMHDINVRGTFAVSQAALPHLLRQAPNPHILTLSPPPSFAGKWYASHPAYTMSKMGMSMVTVGLAEEFRGRVAVNSLWPRTMISTTALQAFAGDQLEDMHRKARRTEIMADAAYAVITQPKDRFSGVFAIDEVVLKAQGITDFRRYACDGIGKDLVVDLFVDEAEQYSVPTMERVLLPRDLPSKL